MDLGVRVTHISHLDAPVCVFVCVYVWRCVCECVWVCLRVRVGLLSWRQLVYKFGEEFKHCLLSSASVLSSAHSPTLFLQLSITCSQVNVWSGIHVCTVFFSNNHMLCMPKGLPAAFCQANPEYMSVHFCLHFHFATVWNAITNESHIICHCSAMMSSVVIWFAWFLIACVNS